MKKTIFLIGLFALSTLFSFGQGSSKKVDITWGPEQKESRKSTLGDIVGYDDTGVYVMKTKRKGLYGMASEIILEHYNNKMTKTASKELELKYQKKEMELEFFEHINNELYVFSSFVNQKQKKRFLFVQSIDKKSLKFNKDLKKVAEIDISDRKKQNVLGGMFFGFESRSSYNVGTFRSETSRDDSKFMIYYQLPYKKGAKKKQLGFHVFDDELNQLWEKKVTYPYEDDLFFVVDRKLSNEGNVYLLGKEYKEKQKSFIRGKANYNYRILSYLNKGEDLKEYPIKVKEKFLTDMQIAVNDDQDIICGGFYSEEGKFSIIGSYFLKVDGTSKEIQSKSFNEFGIDFITQNMTEKQEKKTKKKAAKGKNVELYSYDLDDIVLKDDGGAVLIGEQFYYYTRTSTTTTNGRSTTTTTTYYVFNDIIAINIAPDGDILWTEKIAKRQRSANDGGFFASYALSIVKDKLYFVFNDHKDNLRYKGKGDLRNYSVSKKNSIVLLVELDRSGKQKRTALFSTKDAEVIIRPKVSEQVSKDELILFGQKRKIHRFAKITFK